MALGGLKDESDLKRWLERRENGTGPSTTEGLQVASFQNSWVNYDAANYAPGGYWKDPFGIVHLQGLIKSGSSGTACFTLPVGYRPLKSHIFPSVCQSGGAYVPTELDVASSGVVNPYFTGALDWFSLNGISFRTD